MFKAVFGYFYKKGPFTKIRHIYRVPQKMEVHCDHVKFLMNK